MPVRIITADERQRAADGRTTVFLVGPYGAGKTSLLYTLDPATTLAIDFEGGFKSVETWTGTSTSTLRSWSDVLDIACFIGGPDPAVQLDEKEFSRAHYEYAKSIYGGLIDLSKFKTIFFDSISELATVCKKRAIERNIVYMKDAKTGRILTDQQTGKPIPAREANGDIMIDSRAMYGDVGNDVMMIVRHMQHCVGKNIVWVGKLEKIIDDKTKIETWEPMLEGRQIAKNLPYVVDQIVTLAFFNHSPAIGYTFAPDGASAEHRMFVCRRNNPWGLPAKERTQGNIEMLEPPDLGKLLEKINQPAVSAAAQ